MDAGLKKFAISIVEKAGEQTLSRFGNLKPSEIHYKDDSSPVTDIDRAVNQYLYDEIQKKYPRHGIVSEEIPAKEGEDTFWVIDPIDGTGNYSSGNKIFSVTLALVENSQIVFGIIYFPAMTELYVVEKGRGVTLNDKPLKKIVSQRKNPLIIGFSKYQQSIEEQFNLGKITLQKPYRCATRDLVEVASGAVDGVIYKGIHLWDFAAGVLMVEEMGGKVFDFSRKPYNVGSSNLLVYGIWL